MPKAITWLVSSGLTGAENVETFRFEMFENCRHCLVQEKIGIVFTVNHSFQRSFSAKLRIPPDQYR